MQEADANHSLDDAETISLQVVEYCDETTSSGGKRRRTTGSSCATRLLDDTTYEVMEDVPTHEFHFVVVEATVQERPAANAMQALMRAQSRARTQLVLPQPRNTADMTADDILHNDILGWLEKEGVGWPRSEVMSFGADFVNRITRGLFYLTPDLMTAMSDRHNAGTNSSWPLLAPSLSLPVPFEYYDSIF